MEIMKDNLNMGKKAVKERWLIKMVVNMMVSGKMIKGVVLVYFIKLMDKNIKVNGNKIKKMAKVFSTATKDKDILVDFWTMYLMVKEYYITKIIMVTKYKSNTIFTREKI